MPKILKLLCFFILFLYGSGFCGNFFTGYVKFVPDGDTIILKSGEIIRYIGVDTPEINHGKKEKPQKFSKEAREFNKKITKGQKLKIVFGEKRKDRFKRVLGYVYLEDGRMVNNEILKNGMGWFYHHKDNKKFYSRLLKSQNNALGRNKGIWEVISKIEKPVVLNKKSLRFHALECKNIKASKNKVKVIDAFKKGYSPSRECIKDIFSYGL